MRFRADEVHFVDEHESMVNQAAEITAAAVPQGYVTIASMGVDEFGANSDF
jgi:hypothetical protein